MYDYISGKFTYKTANSKGCFVTVESMGIGYRFEVIPRDFDKLSDLGIDVKMYSHLLHREDKMSFCGFLKREERDIFSTLTSVSGVGSKMALTLLDSFDVSDLVGFVLDGNYKELTRAKGVGPKLAQKIILELKDKMTSYQGVAQNSNSGKRLSNTNPNIEDARSVLLSLGYSEDETVQAIEKTFTKLSTDASAEDILKESLKILSL